MAFEGFEGSVHIVVGAHMVAAGCPGLSALDPVCQVASTVGGIGATVATAGIDAVLSGLSQWVASGAEWLLGQIGAVLLTTTTVDVSASWFRLHYGQMTALAGVVVLPLLVVSTLQAVYKQNAAQLLRAFFVQLPLALLLGVVAIQLVNLCLSATDAMCTAVAGGSDSAVTALLSGVTSGIIKAVGDPSMASFVLLLVGLLIAVAAFVLWLELLIRAAAVYVAVLFLPLALATLVWPSVSHWCRRLVETLAALILSKFVIVATLSLAASAAGSGTAGTGSHGAGFASVLAGGALLVLSTFVPFAILRLIPMVEAGAVGHLEGVRQRSTDVLTRVPRSAAAFAMSEGMAAAGGARLQAQAGLPGTHGKGEGVGRGPSGAGGGHGGAGGGGGGGTGGGGGQEGQGAESNWENGGLIPTADGMMQGIPGSGEAVTARMEESERAPRPRGPKPILGATESPTGSALPKGSGEPLGEEPIKFIGKPQPGQKRYYFGQDECGPVIRFLPPAGADDGPAAATSGTES